MSKNKTVFVFTDGSALKNSKNSDAGYSFFITNINYKLGKYMVGTNNQAELTAIKSALHLLNNLKDYYAKNKITKILIVSDSRYAINALTINEAKLNKELIEKCKNMINRLYYTYKIRVEFKHINSHTKNKGFLYDGNNIVDEIAQWCAKNKSDWNENVNNKQ